MVKKISRKKVIRSLSIIFCIVLFSCTTNAAIDVSEDASGTFAFETKASSGVESLIRSFSGADQSISVFDRSLIEQSFKRADIILLSIEADGTAGISISGKTFDINSLVPSEKQLVTFENTSERGHLSLSINNATMMSLLSLMGEENVIYLELLQAPIFTGGQMTTNEYLDFIGALYGQTMLEELKKSNVVFSLTVPKTVKEVSLSPSNVGDVEYAKKSAKVAISLADFLANTDEIKLEIIW